MEHLPHEKQIIEYAKTIEHLKKQNKDNPLFDGEIQRLEQKLIELKKKVYSELSPWERIQICRHPDRPHSIHYIENICDSFQELHGDRLYGDDLAVIGGLAEIGNSKCVVIGQEKGNDTESRVTRNFGYLHPEGFRKAIRLMKLAEKFALPIVTLVDTPGAYPGLEAEARGQAFAIAQNLRDMFTLQTQLIVVLIGEGASGGALGIGVGDVIGMLRHAYYSAITPEGCASILWKDPKKKEVAGEALKLNAEDMLEYGVVDEIIEEPLGGAHHEPKLAYENVKQFILDKINMLSKIPIPLLLEQRHQKFRQIGKFQETVMQNDSTGQKRQQDIETA